SDCAGVHRALHSFPTRRSSDLAPSWRAAVSRAAAASASLTPEDRLAVTDRAPARRPAGWAPAPPAVAPKGAAAAVWAAASSVTPDRKSTRLNSSHVKISYAVFC